MVMVIGLAIMIFAVIVYFFAPDGKCPDCGGKLKRFYYDAEIDKDVYKCESCGKEYI